MFKDKITVIRFIFSRFFIAVATVIDTIEDRLLLLMMTLMLMFIIQWIFAVRAARSAHDNERLGQNYWSLVKSGSGVIYFESSDGDSDEECENCPPDDKDDGEPDDESDKIECEARRYFICGCDSNEECENCPPDDKDDGGNCSSDKEDLDDTRQCTAFSLFPTFFGHQGNE